MYKNYITPTLMEFPAILTNNYKGYVFPTTPTHTHLVIH